MLQLRTSMADIPAYMAPAVSFTMISFSVLFSFGSKLSSKDEVYDGKAFPEAFGKGLVANRRVNAAESTNKDVLGNLVWKLYHIYNRLMPYLGLPLEASARHPSRDIFH